MAEEKNNREVVGVKVSLDVSEALTGLKAVQREAREATKALRELESYYEQADGRYYAKWTQQGDEISDMQTIKISEVPSEYLRKELVKRGELLDDYIAGKLTEGYTLNDISKLPFMIHPNTDGDSE